MKKLFIPITALFAFILAAAVVAQTYTIYRLNERIDEITSGKTVAQADIASAEDTKTAPTPDQPSNPATSPRGFAAIARSIHGDEPPAPHTQEEEQKDEDPGLAVAPAPNADPARRIPGLSPGMLTMPRSGLHRIDPFEEMRRMDRMMQAMFDSALTTTPFAAPFASSPSGKHSAASSEFQWKEETDHYLLRAELPGVNEDQLRIDIDDKTIRVSGRQDFHQEERDAGGNVVRRSSHSGSFQRAMSLPGPVQVDKATHEYKDGVLTIRLPKKGPEA